MTQRAGQAFDVMVSTSNRELNSYDGVVTVVSSLCLLLSLCLRLVFGPLICKA